MTDLAYRYIPAVTVLNHFKMAHTLDEPTGRLTFDVPAALNLQVWVLDPLVFFGVHARWRWGISIVSVADQEVLMRGEWSSEEGLMHALSLVCFMSRISMATHAEALDYKDGMLRIVSDLEQAAAEAQNRTSDGS